MTRYGDAIEKLDPLTKLQYYGVLYNIGRDKVVFGTDLQKKLKNDLGLSSSQFIKAVKFLVNANLITINENLSQIVATLTDAGREIL